MREIFLDASWNTLLVAVPFLFLLAVAVFRLDETFTLSSHYSRNRRPPCGVDLDGHPILSDPDGTPWRTPRLRNETENQSNQFRGEVFRRSQAQEIGGLARMSATCSSGDRSTLAVLTDRLL
jgi:hypothetical protein